jgi:hypothetical protein
MSFVHVLLWVRPDKIIGDSIRVIKFYNIIWAWNLAHIVEMRNGYILVEKPEGRRPFGIHGRRSKYNIKIAQDRVHSRPCEHLSEPPGP